METEETVFCLSCSEPGPAWTLEIGGTLTYSIQTPQDNQNIVWKQAGLRKRLQNPFETAHSEMEA